MKTKYALLKHILDKIDSNRSNKLGCYGVQLELCLAGVGVGLPFFTAIVYLCYVKAVCRVSMFYHAWNWLKSL